MRMPKQVPPLHRKNIIRKEMVNIISYNRWHNVHSSAITVLRLSEIANNPSIQFDGDRNLVGENPSIVFDLEKPIPPIEMCDVYCGSGMCDVYCIDARERIIHGHIYDTKIISEPIQVKQSITHAHIYGDVKKSPVPKLL